MGLIGKMLPMSRLAVAGWAWRHRHEIGGWLGYATRSAPRLLAGDNADVLLEGRLRARLTADRRTRDLERLHLDVDHGVVTLSGLVPAPARDAALTIATNTTGVKRVRDQLGVEGDRRRGARR